MRNIAEQINERGKMKVINRKTKSVINREAYKASQDSYSMIVENLLIIVQADESGDPVELLVNKALDSLREKIRDAGSYEI